MNQQVDRINFFGGQVPIFQPNALTRSVDITTKGLPSALFVEPNSCSGFLAQNVEPMPPVQLSQDRYRPKFAISDEENRSFRGEQSADIAQQGQLLPGWAMSL